MHTLNIYIFDRLLQMCWWRLNFACVFIQLLYSCIYIEEIYHDGGTHKTTLRSMNEFRIKISDSNMLTRSLGSLVRVKNSTRATKEEDTTTTSRRRQVSTDGVENSLFQFTRDSSRVQLDFRSRCCRSSRWKFPPNDNTKLKKEKHSLDGGFSQATWTKFFLRRLHSICCKVFEPGAKKVVHAKVRVSEDFHINK